MVIFWTVLVWWHAKYDGEKPTVSRWSVKRTSFRVIEEQQVPVQTSFLGIILLIMTIFLWKNKESTSKDANFHRTFKDVVICIKLKWPKSVYKKLSQEDDARPLENRTLTRDIKESHERSKSCPEPCDY